MRHLLHTIDQFWEQSAQWVHKAPWITWLGLLLAVAGFVGGGWIASETVNARSNQGDQNAYIRYARKLRETNFTYLGDRNRMPLYPGIQALFIQADELDAKDKGRDPATAQREIFQRGKLVNIALALAGLTLLTAALWRFLPPWPLFLFTGGLALGLYLPKAAYFQAEILYYTLFTLFFIGGAYLMRHPRWWLAVALGAIAALTHWTKASILPGVALLTLALGMRLAYANWRTARRKPGAARTALQCLLGVILLPTIYLGGIAPYLLKSAEKFDGHYFYNVNSTFYIWLDNFEQAAKLEAAGDRDHWPNLPAEELPSARKYLAEHTPAQIAGRLFSGMYHQYKIAKGSYGAWHFLLPLALLAAWQFWRGRTGLESWARKYNWSLFFALMFFGAYFVLISFYSPIADGARFLFALYAPALAAVILAVESFDRHQRRRLDAALAEPSVKTWVYRLVTVVIVVEFPLKLIFFMGKTYCGS